MAESRLKKDNGEIPPAKKLKKDTESTSESNGDTESIHETTISLSTFEMTRVLYNNTTRKQICVEGVFQGREKPAIVVLEKRNFPDEELFLKRGFFNEGTILRKLFRNDIYGDYECFPTREYNGLKATVIHPATPKHIEKFSRKKVYLVNETYDIYKKVTVPLIESKSFFSLEWIDNILEHKAEVENIVYEDPDKDTGFVLVHDLKWDGQANSLKLIALPFKKITCIRELDGSHLPLLRNIRDAGIASISKKFKLDQSELRIYFHYQPSYYYLHVHFCYLMFDAPGVYAEKAHLLSVVISNLELMPDYYKKAVLSYAVAEGEPLYFKLQEEGVLKQEEEEAEAGAEAEAEAKATEA